MMNLHDWLISVDAKKDGERFIAAAQGWFMITSAVNGQLTLVHEDTGHMLVQGVWACLPSEGWSQRPEGKEWPSI